MAVMIGFSAVLVGSTLEAPPSADDNRIFFVIGAGLSAIVLFLIAEVWQFLAIERGGDCHRDRLRAGLLFGRLFVGAHAGELASLCSQRGGRSNENESERGAQASRR